MCPNEEVTQNEWSQLKAAPADVSHRKNIDCNSLECIDYFKIQEFIMGLSRNKESPHFLPMEVGIVLFLALKVDK